jgi:hypothetical protein
VSHIWLLVILAFAAFLSSCKYERTFNVRLDGRNIKVGFNQFTTAHGPDGVRYEYATTYFLGPTCFHFGCPAAEEATRLFVLVKSDADKIGAKRLVITAVTSSAASEFSAISVDFRKSSGIWNREPDVSYR